MAKSIDMCSELSALQKPCMNVRARELSRFLACPLCKKLCEDAVTINRCNHSFCQKCIIKKIQAVGGLKCCPYCNEDLSSYSPDQYLRPDEALRSITENMLSRNTKSNENVEKPYQLVTRAFESKTETNEKEVGAILKKKRSTRKPRKFPIQENSKKTVENQENSIGKENNKKSSLGEKTLDKVDEKNSEDEDVGLNKFQSFWFHLSPQNDKKELSYPMLSRSYIHVKNVNLSISVSLIHKYLMKKLNLNNEDEIEVCCFGEPLMKALTIRDLYEIWVECVAKAPPSHSFSMKAEGLTVNKIVMELTYRKQLKDEAHPSTLNV